MYYSASLRFSALFIFASLFAGNTASAVDFNVNSTADYIDKNVGDGICEAELSGVYKCTLRAAIQEANARPGLDHINLPTGLFLITLGGPTEDNATQGDFDLLDDVEIIGAGAADTIVDGNNIDRVFHMPDNTGQIVQVTLTGMTVQRGYALDNNGGGGGIKNHEMLTLNNVVVARSGTNHWGGGILNSGTLVAIDSRIDQNFGFVGGGFYANGGDAYLMKSVISANQASTWGGGFYHATGTVQLVDVQVLGNAANTGGGFYSTGELTAFNVLISANTSAANGAGVYVGLKGVVKLAGSLIVANVATLDGGGAAVAGLFVPTNVTISGNAARNGGGIYQEDVKTDALNTTIVFNDATLTGGNIAEAKGIFNIQNSIISNAIRGGNCAGVIDSLGYNIDSDGTCTLKAVADQSNVDPLIVALADNGGPTKTHALQVGSPAINNGSNTTCNSIDQRGYARTDGLCDIGALEANSIPSNAGSVQFEKSSVTVAENLRVVTLNVTRLGGSEGAVSVNYFTKNGSALGGTDFEQTAGTLMWVDGDSSIKTITISVIDDVTKESADETASVFLLYPVGGATLGGVAASTITITDDDWKPGTLQFSSSVYSARESAGSISVTVSRTGGTDGAVSVRFATSDDTANAGSDYGAATGVLQIPDGATSATLSLVVVNDAIVEPGETFNLTLSNPVGRAVLGTTVVAQLIILDDDLRKPGQFRFVKTADAVTEFGGTLDVMVERINGADGSVSVSYGVFSQTATTDVDYINGSGTLTFADGETTKAFTLTILNDGIYELAEQVRFYLDQPTNGASLADSNTINVTIIDDDIAQPGAVQFTLAQMSVVESTFIVDLWVERVGGSDGVVTVNYDLLSSTATPNSEFSGTAGVLTIPHGKTAGVIHVTLSNDAIDEADENFVIALSNTSGGAVLGGIVSTTVTIIDDDVGSETLPSELPVSSAPEGSPAPAVLSTAKSVGGGGAFWLELLLLCLFNAWQRMARRIN